MNLRLKMRTNHKSILISSYKIHYRVDYQIKTPQFTQKYFLNHEWFHKSIQCH